MIFDQVPIMPLGPPDGLVTQPLRHLGQLPAAHHPMRPDTLPQRVEPAPLDLRLIARLIHPVLLRVLIMRKRWPWPGRSLSAGSWRGC